MWKIVLGYVSIYHVTYELLPWEMMLWSTFPGRAVVWVLWVKQWNVLVICPQNVAGKSCAANKDMLWCSSALLLPILSPSKINYNHPVAGSKYVWVSRLTQFCLNIHIFLIQFNSLFFLILKAFFVIKCRRQCRIGSNDELTWEIFKWVE